MGADRWYRVTYKRAGVTTEPEKLDLCAENMYAATGEAIGSIPHSAQILKCELFSEGEAPEARVEALLPGGAVVKITVDKESLTLSHDQLVSLFAEIAKCLVYRSGVHFKVI